MDDPGEDSTDAEVDKEKNAESIYADNKDASLLLNYITCLMLIFLFMYRKTNANLPITLSLSAMAIIIAHSQTS